MGETRDTATTAKKDFPKPDADTLDEYKLDIINDADSTWEQRDNANEDMRFVDVDGGMWEDFVEFEFNDRVKLEVNLISGMLHKFIGEWNTNRIGVKYKPDDSKTSDENAELLSGLYFTDFSQNSGEVAMDNGATETAKCGTGAFKIATRFEDEEDMENDNQRIEFRPIHAAYNSVFWDRSAQRIDKRDARRVTELVQFTPEAFEKEYPDSAAVSAYEPWTRRAWNLSVNRIDVIYIAIRYEKIRVKTTKFIYDNLETSEIEVFSEDDHELIKDELAANPFMKFRRERKAIETSVWKSVFSGEKFLSKPKKIAGKHLPIISMYGYWGYGDSTEWYKGLVRELKDLTRLFNMLVSQLAENAASDGQEKPIFDPDQMLGPVGESWADLNNKSYALAQSLRNKNGDIVQAGPVGYIKPPQLGGSTAALIQLVPEIIQSLTGGAPQETIDPNASGKAINAMIKQINLNTQPIMDNIRRAIEWSGVVYQSIASEIYTLPRTLNILGEDGTEKQQQLLGIVMDEETGRMVESNDLRGKKFHVVSDTGPQFSSRREQTVEDLKGMLDALKDQPAAQKYMPILLGILLQNIEGVGLQPLKDLIRRDMVLQGFVKPETDEEKEMLAQAQQAAQAQGDPQAELLEAVKNQQEAEARSLDASSLQKGADANLKQAQTIKTLAEIEIGKFKALTDRGKIASDIRNQTFQNINRLPI